MSDYTKGLLIHKLLWHNPVTNYLRRRPDSPVTKLIRTALHGADRDGKEPEGKYIPLDSILCGGEHWLSASQYARHTGDLLRPSMPISRSPHVQFLQQYLKIGADIFRPEKFRQTAYFKNAVQCINTVGQYFTCTREDQIEEVARRFVAKFISNNSAENTETPPFPFSPPGAPVLVRPIHYSRCYQVIDGNHRLAVAYVRGKTEHLVRVVGPPVLTPLQQLLLDHVWTRGRQELYQPIESPELANEWVLVRRCTDRFDLMKRFLVEHQLLPPRILTYLDIASSFGWFVKEFDKLGFRAYGVEMDWAACEIARLIFGLGSDRITRAEAVRFLEEERRTYDVVSCFSLLHHFAKGAGSVSAEELLRLLDEKTKAVLFFDMGQCHEEWFSRTLAGWDADYIERWLMTNSSFKKIFRLGTDRDNVPPFERNYGRTLFALLR